MKQVSLFLHAVSFLTRIPVPRFNGSIEHWQQSTAYFPMVGLLLGGLLWGSSALFLQVFPLTVAAVLTLVAWVWLTGGLHLDGWMDLADGLGSNRSREQMLTIMKDSRVGGMGVIASLLLISVKVSALYELERSYSLSWLVFPPFAARFGLVAAIWIWPYLTANGMGSGLRNGLSKWSLLLAFGFVIGLTVILHGILGLLAVASTLLTGWLFARYVNRKLGGMTGDCYGAIVEWIETAMLVFILGFGRYGV